MCQRNSRPPRPVLLVLTGLMHSKVRQTGTPSPGDQIDPPPSERAVRYGSSSSAPPSEIAVRKLCKIRSKFGPKPAKSHQIGPLWPEIDRLAVLRGNVLKGNDLCPQETKGGRARSAPAEARHSVDARLAAGESYRRRRYGIRSVGKLTEKAQGAGHVAEAERAAASATANAREVSERVAEHDRKLSEMSFAGDLRQQAETLRDHGISLMRRAESRGDERSAIAAGSMVQRALEMLTDIKMKETAKAAADEVPLVIITEPGFRVPDWLVEAGAGSGVDALTMGAAMERSRTCLPPAQRRQRRCQITPPFCRPTRTTSPAEPERGRTPPRRTAVGANPQAGNGHHHAEIPS